MESIQIANSSMLTQAQYDNGELRVEFRGGTWYAYESVPVEVWEEFKQSDSKGHFLSSRIKKVYSYKKL
jgi:hypothetical protein